MKSKFVFLSVCASLVFFNFGFLTNQVSAQTVISEIIARTGQQADPASESTFRRFLINNGTTLLPPPIINENNAVAFYASLGGGGTYGSNDDGVWMNSQGGRLRVMRQGDSAPGGSNIYFWGAQGLQLRSSLNESILKAIMTGTGVLPGINDGGIWKVDSQNTTLLARQGNSVPGSVPPGTYKRFPSIPLVGPGTNPASVAIPAEVCHSTGCNYPTDIVLMPESASPVRIQEGTPAPGTSGASFLSFENIKSGIGNLFYLGQLTGGDVTSIVVGGTTLSNATGLWRDTGNSTPQLITRTLDPLTSDPNGPVIGTISNVSKSPIETATGNVIFNVTRYLRSTGASLGEGLYKWSSGVVSPIIVRNDPITGLTGVTFDSVLTSVFSNSIWSSGNDITTIAQLAGTGVTTSNNKAILRINNGQTTVLARGSQPAVGTPAGQTYLNSTIDALRVTQSGKYAYVARLQGVGVTTANNMGIWTGDNGTQTLALRMGMVIGNHYIYSLGGDISSIQDYQINDLGDMVVEATISVVGDPWNTRYRAIIGYTPEAGPQLVAVSGEPLQTTAGPTPTILSFKRDTKQALNNNGKVAFAVKFNGPVEDEGVAVSTLATSISTCPADFDGNGIADVADIFAFLSAWFAGSSTADADNNGQVQVQDIFTFLSTWFAGC